MKILSNLRHQNKNRLENSFAPVINELFGKKSIFWRNIHQCLQVRQNCGSEKMRILVNPHTTNK